AGSPTPATKESPRKHSRTSGTSPLPLVQLVHPDAATLSQWLASKARGHDSRDASVPDGGVTGVPCGPTPPAVARMDRPGDRALPRGRGSTAGTVAVVVKAPVRGGCVRRRGAGMAGRAARR